MKKTTISPFEGQKSLTICLGNDAPPVVDIGEQNAFMIIKALITKRRERSDVPSKHFRNAINFVKQWAN